MKSVQQLKEEIYEQAMSSGYFKSMQGQLKTYVYDKEYNSGRSKTGFQYEHPLLPKLRKFPLTSLCMDLIQQFLQSFKFKHTLNVFMKEVNRTQKVSRAVLAEQFRIQIKNPEAQAVLLSLVSQMASGDVGAVREPVLSNNFMDKKSEQPARSNYMMEPQKSQQSTQQTNGKSNVSGPLPAQKPSNQSSSINVSSSSAMNDSKSAINSNSSSNVEPKNEVPGKAVPSAEASLNSNVTGSDNSSEMKGEKQGKKEKEKKKKVEKEKPPEGATDLLGDVMKKFEGIAKVNKQQEKKEIFESKRAFSQEKAKKVADPSESGVNKIRGISAGKPMSSLMSKFMPQAAAPKNESIIEEEIDEFQQSKDSTRRNPLFSSSESGFEKSAFDYSVDSNSIQQYEYVERARKPFKKA